MYGSYTVLVVEMWSSCHVVVIRHPYVHTTTGMTTFLYHPARLRDTLLQVLPYLPIANNRESARIEMDGSRAAYGHVVRGEHRPACSVLALCCTTVDDIIINAT